MAAMEDAAAHDASAGALETLHRELAAQLEEAGGFTAPEIARLLPLPSSAPPPGQLKHSCMTCFEPCAAAPRPGMPLSCHGCALRAIAAGLTADFVRNARRALEELTRSGAEPMPGNAR